MIKSLKLTNFESHKDTQISFAPQLTVVVGDSEQGKSTILRALDWVVFNKPNKDSFRSTWGGDTKVELTTDTHTILRKKTNKENSYYLDGKPFTAFGQGVPIDITNALNIRPINTQTQFESHFLLPPVSPGEVARQINQYVDLEIIDTSLFNINAVVRDLSKEATALQTEIGKQETEIREYDYVDSANTLLSSLERKETRIQSVNTSLSQLKKLCLDLSNVEEKLSHCVDVDTAAKKLKQMEALLERIAAIEGEQHNLAAIIDALKSKEAKLKRYEHVATKEVQINKLLQIVQAIHENETLWGKLMKCMDALKYMQSQITLLAKRIQEKEKLFLEKMPPICPLCGSKL